MTMSLRPGESRTCHGCHDGHSEERWYELGEVQAVDRYKDTLAAKTNPPMLDTNLTVTFDDIQPLLTDGCGSCHEGFQNDGQLWSRLTQDYDQIDWPWMTRWQTLSADYKLPRPYGSGLMARLPKESPLYWYCRNERTDGRLNSDYPDDLDYMPPELGPHESGATEEECELIARWINQGLQR